MILDSRVESRLFPGGLIVVILGSRGPMCISGVKVYSYRYIRIFEPWCSCSCSALALPIDYTSAKTCYLYVRVRVSSMERGETRSGGGAAARWGEVSLHLAAKGERRCPRGVSLRERERILTEPRGLGWNHVKEWGCVRRM